MELNFYIWRPHFRFEPEEIELENLASSGEEKSGEGATSLQLYQGFFFVYYGLQEI